MAELNRFEAVYDSLLKDSGVNVIRGTAEIVNPNRVCIGSDEITGGTAVDCHGKPAGLCTDSWLGSGSYFRRYPEPA